MSISEIIKDAQKYLASLDIDQWQHGYPNKSQIELDIKKSMGEKEMMVSEDGEVLSTWKSSITNRFDTKKFKTEHPLDYSNYINATESRRFLIKEIN